MVSPLIYLIYSFLGAIFLGITAVFLKLAHVDDVYFGLIIRALGSAPLVILIVIYLQGFAFLSLLSWSIVGLLALSAIFLMLADILIMTILKRKPVGMITPMIAIFPLYTTIFLIATGYTNFNAMILFYTILVVVGVALVTYDRSIDDSTGLRVAPFDREAILYGMGIALMLGLTNFVDVVIISDVSDMDGLTYTGFKFTMLFFLSTLAFFLTGRKISDWKQFTNNVSSTGYLFLAGFFAWFMGSLFIYTSYDKTDPNLVNAIIGTNPVFAVLTSLFLKMEKMNIQKGLGLICCIIASIGIVNL